MSRLPQFGRAARAKSTDEAPSEMAGYGKRGRKALSDQYRYLVEEESLSMDELATRIGQTRGCTATRMRREQAKPGPVTLAGLRSRT